MHTVQDIDGTTLARGLVTADQIQLTLCAPSGFTDTKAYFPAESLTFDTIEGIAALRQLCDEMIDAHGELTQEVAP